MSTIPNPSVMARFATKRQQAQQALLEVLTGPTIGNVTLGVVADTQPEQDAKIVRPGLRTVTEYVEHDGVVKAKHLKEGMRVRAYLHGKACGGERVVKSVQRSEDGSMVRVEFSSPHPTTDYKAAYRFYVADLAGTLVAKAHQVPALVPYEEV